MKTPHKHADLIKAWADGAEIEYWEKYGAQWVECGGSAPTWEEYQDYRIKPAPPSDIVSYVYAHEGRWLRFCEKRYNEYNLIITFDGETGKPKTVEVIT